MLIAASVTVPPPVRKIWPLSLMATEPPGTLNGASNSLFEVPDVVKLPMLLNDRGSAGARGLVKPPRAFHHECAQIVENATVRRMDGVEVASRPCRRLAGGIVDCAAIEIE